MKIHFGGRLFLVAAVLGVAAVFAVGLLVALGGRSVVAGPGASPGAPTPVGHEWSQVEGHGTDAAGWWLGTTVSQALELRVNSARALRLEPNATSPNVIGGYSGNSVTAGAKGAAIGGGGASGFTNRVTDDYGTVGGGYSNQAGDNLNTTTDAPYATVAGGQQNTAQVAWSAVGGGFGNTASGWGATVAGGAGNAASGLSSSVGGGDGNAASASYATIAGGYDNTASGQYSTVPGGSVNAAVGAYSFAAGRRAKANHQGVFVWADSTDADFASTANNQFLVRANGGVSLNVTSGGLRLESNATSPNVIEGYSGNSVTASVLGATIGGGGESGFTNRVTDNYGTVAGGVNNQAGDNAGTTSDRTYATVGGGSANTASGLFATVPGGTSNVAAGAYSLAAGRRAKANHQGVFVWADSTNADFASTANDQFLVRASGGVSLNVTSGGLRLEPNATSPNVIEGYSANSVTASVVGATISGGGYSANTNRVTDDYGTVGGGGNNQAGDGGGTTADRINATVGGGKNNTASGYASTIAGGASNTASGAQATVGGGNNNTATIDWSTVGGGDLNSASGVSATVGGGISNDASANNATIAGGYDNTASGSASTVAGGYASTASGSAATVGGGNSNTVTDDYGTVAGGWSNQAGDGGVTTDRTYATVGGGYDNTASGQYATVGGGRSNTASASYATVAGGFSNTAALDYATVGGGSSNAATGSQATVPGGFNNAAVGNASFAAGYRAKANHQGAFVWADSTDADFASTAANQFLVRASGGVSLNTTSGGLRLESNATSPNVIGGYSGNSVTTNVVGATISGGGASGSTNSVTDEYGTVGGGYKNQAGDGLGGTSDKVYATVAGGYSNAATGYSSTIPGGFDNTASGSYSFAAGYEAQATDTGSFVWSSYETTSSTGTYTFTVRSHNGAKFYTASGTGTGVQLAAGGTGWSSISDRNVKENFTPVDGQEVLASLADMPITTWNLKSQDPAIRHMGPVAQDFSAAFGLGEDELYINTVDADGVALAAIQGLYELSQEQAARIQALEEENASLQQRLDDLDVRVSALDGGASTSGAATGPLSGLTPAWLLLGGLLLVGLVVVQRRRAGGRP